MTQKLNLNSRAQAICQQVIDQSRALDVEEIKLTNGAKVLDFGSDRFGSEAGGIMLSKICLADLADVKSVTADEDSISTSMIRVETDHPIEACIASQYAGWPFSTESFFSMCSGPARLKRGREEILTRFGLTSDEELAVAVFESNQLPVESDIADFAEECGCREDQVTICVARTKSLPGTMQVLARSVETAMHKLFELDFDLTRVKRGIGYAPIPPPAEDDYRAMGWTNDAILYGGDVHLWIDRADGLNELIERLPSSSSHEFGRPFIEIFEECDRDFYKVDRMLFSPAKITVTSRDTGDSMAAGAVRNDLLKASFEATSA